MTRFFLIFLLALALPVHAELADKDKPITLEADRITIDDLKRVQVFEGNVVLTQGTLVIRSDKILLTEDAQGFQRGVAFAGPGGLARFQQKREGRDELIEGEAERIEYDTNREIAELFHRAWIRSGGDELRGDYIWYDGFSERYMVSGRPASSSSSTQDSAPPKRVQAIIQPRNKPEAGNTAPPSPAGVSGFELKSSGDMSAPERP